MLDKQKQNRIKFRTEPVENMKITSKEELQEMKKAEAQYNEFMQDNLQDPEIDKNLDNIIDEQIKKGKSDTEILRHLGGVTGLGREPLTRGEQEQRERAMAKELNARLKK